MLKEDLVLLKQKLSFLNEKQLQERNKYLAKLGRGEIQGPSTGYASIDKPGLQYYPDVLFNVRNNKHTKIFDRMCAAWSDDDIMIHYYGNDIAKSEFVSKVKNIARSLKKKGFSEDESIIMSIDSVPEFLEFFLAAEMIGCSVKNYHGNVDDIIHVLKDNKSKIYFAHDYIDESISEKIYNSTDVEHIITIDPLFSAGPKEKIRTSIMSNVKDKYTNYKSVDDRNISFAEFLESSKNEKDVIPVLEDKHLFSAFTSGSTGKPKEVKLTSGTILGEINQMALFPSQSDVRETWMLPPYPPILVAVVVAEICYPLIDGKKLILNPYCKPEDIDLEMMHYKPNSWPIVPSFLPYIMESERIPDDYDMSHFKMFGFGAEPIHFKTVKKCQEFLQKHNCYVPLSMGYGQSEAGADITIAMGTDVLLSGSSGIPLIDTNIAIYDHNTLEELPYNTVGEIAISGPGLMLGYSDDDLTEKTIRVLEDGQRWLFTGDTGYITENGNLFVFGRGGIKIFPSSKIFPLRIENKILEAEEVKEAIIVSGDDIKNPGYEVPYLFVVPEEGVNEDVMLEKVSDIIETKLLDEEKPKNVFVIDKKPIKNFKTDRQKLKVKYKL